MFSSQTPGQASDWPDSADYLLDKKHDNCIYKHSNWNLSQAKQH